MNNAVRDMTLYMTLTKTCEEFGIEYIKRIYNWGILLLFHIPDYAMVIKFSPFGTKYFLYEFNPALSLERVIEQGDLYAEHLNIVQEIIEKYKNIRNVT